MTIWPPSRRSAILCPTCATPYVCLNCHLKEDQVTRSPQPEAVDHPPHYGGADDPHEHVKVAEAKGWTTRAFVYNCTKYLWRLGLKPGAEELEDLRKARWYLDREISRIEREGT